MKFHTIYQKLTQQQKEIDDHGKLSKELLNKINYKFRLDWNYYSNRMEGGTLTKAETRSVMVGNITVDGKPMKDIMEMSGHDDVVRSILSMGKGEMRISEKRIKDIHREIIKHNDDADTDQPIGDWKTKNNEIINYKGEKITFSPPDEVPDAIHKLLNKTNADLDALFANKPKQKHPLQIASEFHIGFVSIHPFFDGNGRTARILMNLILVACGYPPIIIDETAKKAYYQYLADIQAYGGNPDLFHGQMGQLLLKSQQLVLDAIAGKEIEDEDDLDKRIALADKNIKSLKDVTEMPEKSARYIRDIINNNVLQMLYELDRELLMKKPRDWFTKAQVAIQVDGNKPTLFDYVPSSQEEILSGMKVDMPKEFNVMMNFLEFKASKPKEVNMYIKIITAFEKYRYCITYGRTKRCFPYHYLSDPTELKKWCKSISNEFMDEVDAEFNRQNKD